MKIKQLLIAALLVIATVVGFRVVTLAQTPPKEVTPPPASILNVQTGDLPKGSMAETEMLTATLAPGETSVWHVHKAPVFAYTISGEYVVDFKSGQPSITIPAGKAVMEPINVVVRARNPSSTQPAKLVLFQVREPGSDFLYPVSD